MHNDFWAKITLASASPRRRELLAQIGIDTEIRPTHADEESISLETVLGDGVPYPQAVGELALRRARLKIATARAVPGAPIVLAADTIVSLDGELLEKPVDAEDAGRMLRTLSAKTHLVHTAVVARSTASALDPPKEEIAVTKVTFTKLLPMEIDWYIASGEWRGVAGAYRIQNRAAAFITKIEGSYGAVVGLPLGQVYAIISELSTDRV